MRRAALLACLVLVIPACGGDGDGGDVRTLTEADSGTTLDVPSGESFRVLLEANQTTPYRWHLSKVPDPAIVDLVRSDYEADPNPEERTGSGGTSIWTFTARGTGATTIGLAYVEIGKDVPERNDFSLTVEVSSKR